MKSMLVVLAFVLTACQQSPAPSFPDRVASAEALEETPEGARFVAALVQEHSESINAFAGECYASSNLEHDVFTLVADVGTDGSFGNVVVQPETAQTLCYAEKVGTLRTGAPRPPDFADRPLPLVINVTYDK